VFETGPEERLRAYYDRMAEPRPLRPRSKAAWLQRRAEVRAKTLAALGLSPMPDRLPLETRQGGSLERDGYRVERVYWQTWPQVWASGWLYLPAGPEGPKGKVPAILNPHGHWEHGARHPTVQSRLISLAKLGYVALAPDSLHLYDYATGLTPLTAMTYQNLRALDYLLARPDVDRERLGVTGASGGAQQAMYLLAIDDRIKAGVLAVLVTYFKRILMPEGHHCPCNHVPGITRFTDEAELCGIASPRALLYLTVTGDWTAPFPDHELGELRALYNLWQQPDRLAHRQFPGPHDYNQAMREAAYSWFERELRGNRAAEDVKEPPHQVESLETLDALDAPPAEDRGPDGILDWYGKRGVAQPPQLESRQSRRNYQERVRAELTELLGGEPEAVTLETEWQTRDGRRETGNDPSEPQHPTPIAVSFRTERDVRIPALWLPGPGKGPWPAVVALHPEGKAGALRSAVVRGLREAGWAVLAPDVRLRGEMARDWFYNCVIWGRPEAGMAARDARTCVDWLLEREEVDYRAVALLGEGDLGVAALLAGGLDERVSAVLADCCETTYRDGGEGLPPIPNLLRVADVPQIASLVAPRPLWLYRVPEERVGFSSRRYYDWTRRSFQSLGEPDALKMSTGPLPASSLLTDWLEGRIKRAKRT
jgi:dienelactone hydrolase